MSSESRRIRILADGVQQRARRMLPPKPNLPFPYGAPPTPHEVRKQPAESSTGADFDTDWARRPSARMARGAIVEGVLRPSVAVVARPTRLGADRLNSLADDEAVIFVANHHSHIDTPLLLTSIPDPRRNRVVVAAAADYFFGNRVSGTVAALALGAIPMERKRTTRSSANQAADLVKEGWSLLIFPEGGRSKDGWGQDFRAGAAYLAQRCDVAVVPVHIAGTGRILRKGKALPRPSATTVNFGEPLRAEPDESSRAFSARIESAVGVLGDETATDWWQARKRAHGNNVPSRTGPDVASWRRSWALGDPHKRAESSRKRWPYI